jgi:hypothetical protein
MMKKKEKRNVTVPGAQYTSGAPTALLLILLVLLQGDICVLTHRCGRGCVGMWVDACRRVNRIVVVVTRDS